MSDGLSQKIVRLSDWCEKRNFAGADPYDALNSRLAPLLTLNTKYGRVFWTQVLRRSPIDLRPLLLVPPGRNPKGLGLFLESYCRMAILQPEETRWRDSARKLLAGLQETVSSGYHGNCWGYHFPWQSWVAFVPRGVPTIVNTAFIGHALLDAWQVWKSEEALTLAFSTADFMLNDLNRKQEKDTFCFSYTPLDHNYVHNANLLGASLLARLAITTGRPELAAPAQESMAYSMAHQHEDGSWYYGEHQAQRYIDSFHTGFNLESLRRVLKLKLAPDGWTEAFERGKKYYRETFFGEDLTPKYYHDRVYCVDAHAPAEAIYFFAGEGAAGGDFAGKLLEWFFTHMYDPGHGYFYYRKTGEKVSKIPYMRWVEAWALRGLTEYCYRVEGKNQT
ncbi:delta-aminolevulinic acid dehydratase [Victivallis lenta]|uniref:delta-aminolevulinic acid dehydratase n=1 Tax=Victivallis lenta TaxID=2606640 RepID=UPI003AB33A26